MKFFWFFDFFPFLVNWIRLVLWSTAKHTTSNKKNQKKFKKNKILIIQKMFNNFLFSNFFERFLLQLLNLEKRQNFSFRKKKRNFKKVYFLFLELSGFFLWFFSFVSISSMEDHIGQNALHLAAATGKEKKKLKKHFKNSKNYKKCKTHFHFWKFRRKIEKI